MEYCEWTKTDGGHLACFSERLFTSEDVVFFKYCPYCSKKIRVATKKEPEKMTILEYHLFCRDHWPMIRIDDKCHWVPFWVSTYTWLEKGSKLQYLIPPSDSAEDEIVGTIEII